MDSSILEKVNGGLLYLYSASCRKELCGHLESFLSELFRSLSFSILTPTEDPGSFHVEYVTGFDLPSFERTTVVSPQLLEVCRRGGGKSPQSGSLLEIVIGGRNLPVHDCRVMEVAGSVLGLLVFHESLELQGDGELEGVDDYVFDHVFTAYQYVAQRDLLSERLEGSEAKLDGISEISGALGQFELETLLSHLLSVYIRLTEAQVGSIVLHEGLGADVEWGLPRSALDQLRERNGKPLHEVVRDSGEPVVVRGYSGDSRFEPLSGFNIDSFMCVPLVAKDRILGTVNLVNSGASKGGMFTDMDRATVLTISSLAASAIENVILHNDLLEKERIKASLQIARSIQQGMYPVKGLVIPGYEMAWVTRSCDETGGDYFDFFTLGDGRAALAIGDVSGHGIGAALLMTAGRANLRALLSVRSDLKDVVERLNDLLASDMDDAKFMTLFLASLDHRKHEVVFVNAGHDQPLIFRRRTSTCDELDATGLPVGMIAGAAYEVGTVAPLEPGDVFLLTTDGVWEATNAGGERFGKDRLGEILRHAAGGSPREVIDAILKSVESYTGGLVHPDDSTLLVLKRVE